MVTSNNKKNLYICAVESDYLFFRRGHESPLFILKNMLKRKVETLLNEFFKERKDLFLIKLSVSLDNKIEVIIDGDKGVMLSDCISASRQVEHNLDRETEDFSLEVASAGATDPIVDPRQYNKNIGRKLMVKIEDEKLEGNLVEVTQQSIKLEWKVREPKPIGKGKVTIQKEKEILFKDIVEARVMITF